MSRSENEEETFYYEDADFFYDYTSRKSKFEEKLERKWNFAFSIGLFNYSLENMKTRITDGKKKFVIQLNEKRLTERRNPIIYNSCNAPFNENEFNFNKVLSKEFLFELKHKSESNGIMEEKKNMILINNSPLEKFHILLVPSISQCLNQQITTNLLKMCLDTMLLCSSNGWKIGFNSLCALASVNHQHAHAWKINYPLYIETAPVLHIEKEFYILEDENNNAIAFQLKSKNVQKLVQNIFCVVSYLQENEIPHNMIITRGLSFDTQQKCTIRVFIWPRKKFVDCKKTTATFNGFNIACAELAGHIPVYDSKVFDTLSEDTISNIISKELYDKKEFNTILSAIRGLC